MDNILEVKNLQISFRTSNGILKAVRNISFDLERGRTLAIVGESGSGKSVTSKAILGILAGNSIVEGGEILYDGKDLLTIDEDEMYKIRGDKVAMIFQDPLSSLNPIVKIGKQITEAMLLKNKANRREAKAEYKAMLALLKKNMLDAKAATPAEISEAISTFEKFTVKATSLENDFNNMLEKTVDLQAQIEDFLFKYEKKQKLDIKASLKNFGKKLGSIDNEFLTKSQKDELARLSAAVLGADESTMVGYLKDASALLKRLNSEERPNFFRIGYYEFAGNSVDINAQSVEKLNETTLAYMDEHFMNNFLKLVDKAVRYSFDQALEAKKAALPVLAEAKEFFSGEFTKSSAKAMAKKVADAIAPSIDKLQIKKDSAAYTCAGTIEREIENYYLYLKKNPKEEKRYERQTKKRERLISRGKTVEWKVIPKHIIDPQDSVDHIITVLERVNDNYTAFINNAQTTDFNAIDVEIIDFLKEKASLIVYKVTKSMAREKAIKLMEEVGISEPRQRYYQYPFEFSGGMRQRIVIAIALAANPDILICDEPTTALDVTIQAQILELINNLKRDRNLSVIFITHDLGVVANMADDIAVMYAGKIVEYGTADDIFYDPRHPYTWALLSSMPDLDTNEKLDAIPGTPPNMIYPPVGDAFADRNKYALKIDFEMEPPMFEVSETHRAATWLLHPSAPKAEMPKIIAERIAKMKKAGGEVNE